MRSAIGGDWPTRRRGTLLGEVGLGSGLSAARARYTYSRSAASSSAPDIRCSHPDLARHVHQTITRQVAGRGTRLDKADPAHQIDALVSLAMAVARAEHQPAPAQLIAWA